MQGGGKVQSRLREDVTGIDRGFRARGLDRIVASQLADDDIGCQLPAWRRRASSLTPASISFGDLAAPSKGKLPKTSSGRVSAKTGSGFSNTPSPVLSTAKRVPGFQRSASRIPLGRMI